MTWGGEPFEVSQLDAWVGILTALGTLLTVVAAVWIALREHNARIKAEARSKLLEERDRERDKRELERLHAMDEREARAQAARITVRTEPQAQQGFMVDNASDLPIFDARIFAMVPGSGVYPVMPDGSRGEEAMSWGESEPANIRPGQSEGFVISQWDSIKQYVSTFAVRFQDANEETWLRTGTGQLDRVPDDPDEFERLVEERLRAPWIARAEADAERRAFVEELYRHAHSEDSEEPPHGPAVQE